MEDIETKDDETAVEESIQHKDEDDEDEVEDKPVTANQKAKYDQYKHIQR